MTHARSTLRQERLRKGWSQQQLADFAQVSVSSVERAERGEPIRVDICRRLCDCLEKDSPEDLDLRCIAGREERGKAVDVPVANGELVVSLTAETASLQSYLLNNDDVLARLARAVKKPAGLDNAVLSLLETKTKSNWQLYANFDISVQYKYDMLDSVLGHLQTITRLMEHPQPTPAHNRLAFLASETTQLIGEIYFDLKTNSTAEKYYDTSIEIARETQDNVSLAVTLGRKSFIPIYSNDALKALSLLQEAYSKLKHNDSDIILAWLSAREAEVYANMNDGDACFAALERAEMYLEKAQPDAARSFAFVGEAVDVHFTRSMLLGFKGACYTRLNLPKDAQVALKSDLDIMNPSRSNHKAIVLVDLAKTFVQQGEIEEACKYAEEALSIMVQLKSARVFQRLLGLRRELDVWKDAECVKRLDQQIVTTPYIQGEGK